MIVQYFRAAKQTHRFRQNQKVWIRANFANHLWVWFKWRGSGRYVSGTLDKFDKCVGEIKTIEVEDDFAKRIYGGLGFPPTERELELHPLQDKKP